MIGLFLISRTTRDHLDAPADSVMGAIATRITAGEIAHALGGKRTGPNSYRRECPAHEDRTPSLSLTDTGDGLVLWRCHAGCSATRRARALVPAGLAASW